MDDEKKALNLDELFGQTRAVKVIWQKKEYELVRMEALGPNQWVKFQKLRTRANDVQRDAREESDDQAQELESIFNDMLVMLCKDLPVNEMPFAMKMRVVVYYTEQTEGKKVMDLALGKMRRQTGARSSRK